MFGLLPVITIMGSRGCFLGKSHTLEGTIELGQIVLPLDIVVVDLEHFKASMAGVLGHGQQVAAVGTYQTGDEVVPEAMNRLDNAQVLQSPADNEAQAPRGQSPAVVASAPE